MNSVLMATNSIFQHLWTAEAHEVHEAKVAIGLTISATCQWFTKFQRGNVCQTKMMVINSMHQAPVIFRQFKIRNNTIKISESVYISECYLIQICDMTNTVYWVLFIGVKCSLFSLSPFNSEHFTTATIYFTYESTRKPINCEIIGTRIVSDT